MAYVGTAGSHLYHDYQLNQCNPPSFTIATPPPAYPACLPFYSINPNITTVDSRNSTGNSHYNAMQLELQKRTARGLTLTAAYTWSKMMDNINNPIDSYATRQELDTDWQRNNFPQVLVVSYVYELPFGRNKQWLGTASPLVDALVGNWGVSGITTFQSGFPIRILSTADQELQNSFDFELPGKPDLVAPFTTFDPRNHDGYAFDPNSFATATLGTLGTAKRTICCGPGIKNFDVSIQKDTPVGENKNLQFRAEFFNMFNVTQFLNPDGNISDGVDFGRVKRARDPRQIQFALKYSF